jgi:hypothetical protein
MRINLYNNFLKINIIVQGSTKLSPVPHIVSGTKKAVMSKKEVIDARNLKDLTKFTTQIKTQQKEINPHHLLCFVISVPF